MSEHQLELQSPQDKRSSVLRSVEPHDKITVSKLANETLTVGTKADLLEAANMGNPTVVKESSGDTDRVLMEFQSAMLTKVAEPLPKWAEETFKPQLDEIKARSYREAAKLAKDSLGLLSKASPPRDTGRFSGKIIGETELHYAQKVGRKTAVLHLKNSFHSKLPVGGNVSIIRAGGKVISVSDQQSTLTK